MTTERMLPMQLTDRDLRILQSLEDGQYLTVEALEWLHVPSWRERWERWNRRIAAVPSGRPSYKSSTSFRKRLRQLEAAGFMLRVKRPLTVGRSLRRDGDLYALRAAGAELLAAYGENAPPDVWHAEPDVLSAPMLVHSCELGQVYAALRAAMATTPGVRMEAWVCAPRLVMAAGGDTLVQPDASFRLITPDGERVCFVELDRGCSATTWQVKVRAYMEVEAGTLAPLVLTMTHTRSQRARLMAATAEVLARPSAAYLFSLLENAHPARIDQWLAIREVVFRPGDQFGSVGPQVDVTAASHILF